MRTVHDDLGLTGTATENSERVAAAPAVETGQSEMSEMSSKQPQAARAGAEHAVDWGKTLSFFACAVLLGLGLGISGMSDPRHASGFFNLYNIPLGVWDPSLAIVLLQHSPQTRSSITFSKSRLPSPCSGVTLTSLAAWILTTSL